MKLAGILALAVMYGCSDVENDNTKFLTQEQLSDEVGPDPVNPEQQAAVGDSEVVGEVELSPPEDKYEIVPGEMQQVFLAFSSCVDVKEKIPNAANGIYPLYYTEVDNTVKVLNAYCDMEAEGGGWTMALNYVHQGNTNPPRLVRADSFPMLGQGNLGDDEQNTDFFGHIAPTLLSKFNVNEVRLYCVTSNNNRVMHFKTSDTTCLDYFKTGMGNCDNVGNDFTALTGHTANLPADIDPGSEDDAGDFAMTDSTLRSPMGTRHWSVGGNNGQWECDDDPDNAVNSTLHRVWFR